MEKNYIEAIQSYKTAFENVPYAHNKDYINAILCAVSVKRNDLVFQWFDSLVVRGASIESIKNHKNLWHLVNEDSARWNRFEANYQNMRKIYESKNKETYKECIERNTHKIDEMKEKYNKKHSDCHIFFEEIIKMLANEGFPKEVISFERSANEPNTVEKDIVTLSCFDNSTDFNSHKPFLLRLVKFGILSPEDYVEQVDTQHEPHFEFYGSNVLLYENDKKTREINYFYPFRNEYATMNIDRERNKIGLPTLEETRKIILFNEKWERKKIKWQFNSCKYEISPIKMFKHMYAEIIQIKND